MLALLPILALLTALGLTAPYATTSTPTVRIDSARGLPDTEAQHAIWTADSLDGSHGNGWTSTCPHTVSSSPAPQIVALAHRAEVEPARATTCYLGLDCPE